MICQYKTKSAIKNLFHGVVARHLEVSAEDGWYIFINKKVMGVFVSHDFKANMFLIADFFLKLTDHYTLSVMICHFKKKTAIKKLFHRVHRYLEVICAKDGWYIFINKKSYGHFREASFLRKNI